MAKHVSTLQALGRGIRVIDKKRLPNKHYSLTESDGKWHLFYKGELLARYYDGMRAIQGAYEHNKRTLTPWKPDNGMMMKHKPAT